MNLTPELEKQRIEIEKYARGYRLDFFDIIFQVLTFDEMNEVASYGGFPTRYPHWRFGMEYEQLKKGYAYGLQKIYEMVINNDPCYAFLLECNNIVDQKIVMAHVYAHCDFFKNNQWFSKTNRKMMDEIANHGVRVRRHIEKYGEDKVDEFLDACLSLENLIDYHSPFIQRRELRKDNLHYEEDKKIETSRLPIGREYMDGFINPQEVIDAENKKRADEKEKKKKLPENPEKDVLLFLIEHAPLEKWQGDILSIIREESYYFAPQGQTKIMNEGWATYWHSKIMTQKALTGAELIDYADHHSGTLGTRPGRINPYKIGIELFRDIEERWNKGKHGKEYDECEDFDKKRNWNLKEDIGIEKIFEVRKTNNDVTFIDTYLTEEFCKEQQMFTYKHNPKGNYYEISSRELKEIKDRLLFSLTNFGQPFIYVVDGNYENKGELYLMHMHEGMDLKVDYAKSTLSNLHQIWKRPVHIETRVADKKTLLSYDGKEHREREIKQ